MSEAPVTAETLMVGLRLSGARCLVVGSADEAVDRAARLVNAGAIVTLVCEHPSERTRRVAADEGIAIVERRFRDDDLDGQRLAVLTDRDAELAARMDGRCRAANVLFCAIDQPYGDFAHVSIVRRGPLSLGISTDGAAPALARRLREQLTRLLDSPALDAFVTELTRLRSEIAAPERKRVLSAAVRRLKIVGRVEIAPPSEDDPPNGRRTE